MAHPYPADAHGDAHDGAGHGGSGHGHHIIPQRTLLLTLGGLVALTALTVATGTADWIPGFLHVPLALFIATIKVAMVVTIFMGLKYDNRVNGLAFVVSIVFVLIFLTFTMFDVAFRGDLGNVNAQTIRDEQAITVQDSMLAARYKTLLVAPGDSAAAAGAPADTVSTARPPTADTTRAAGDTPPPAAPLDTTAAQQ